MNPVFVPQVAMPGDTDDQGSQQLGALESR
jgi:hypothetical protein